MSSRLTRDQKIRLKIEFDQAFKLGKCLYGRNFLAYYRDNELAHARIGVIASKRSVRLAVDRNRIRRIVKEQFRVNQSKLTNVDIVVIAKKGIGQSINIELRRCILHLLEKIATLHKKP